MSSFTACKTFSICTIYCTCTLNTVSSPRLPCPLLIWPQWSDSESLCNNATATLNNSTSSQGEQTEHRELILEPSGIETTTCSCLSLTCRLRRRGGDSGRSKQEQCWTVVRGALCVRGECQGATSYRTWCSLKNWSSFWIPARWSSRQRMKSGLTFT